MKVKKWVLRAGVAVSIVALLLVILGYLMVAGSLPQVEGVCKLRGLAETVTVARDARGIPTITGNSRLDVARAMGYVHAQDRLFQMDMLRRTAAGELSELLGAQTIEADKQALLHQFRKRAILCLTAMAVDDRKLLEAYTDGVNAGLESLRVRPFEYLLLGQRPRKWVAEDSVLVMYFLYMTLQDHSGWHDLCRQAMRENLAYNAYQFFVHNGGSWQATLDGSERPSLATPSASDLRLFNRGEVKGSKTALHSTTIPMGVPGSNAWVVAGNLTNSGAALLANDMHLELAVPAVWYRVQTEYDEGLGGKACVVGVTLPGLPLMIAGSNQHVAWGFTNSMADTSDIWILKTVKGDRNQYATMDGGTGRLVVEKQVIKVRGAASVETEVRLTDLGPVIGEGKEGQLLVMKWTAHSPIAVNMRLVGMESARTIGEALAKRGQFGLPLVNMMMAGKNGEIGWCLTGSWLDRKSAYDGDLPHALENLSVAQAGVVKLAGELQYKVAESGYLWNGNDRQLADSEVEKFGGGDFVNSARSHQIKRRLGEKKLFSESDMLDIQLDDEALFLQRWQTLFLDVLGKMPPSSEPREVLEDHVKRWSGRASVHSVGYHLVRRFRLATADRVLQRLLAPSYEAYDRFSYESFDYEEALWSILEKRPDDLKDANLGGWDKELEAAVNDVIAFIDRYFKSDVRRMEWGARNTTMIRHPLAVGLPKWIVWLDMPREQIPGDLNMPRVVSPTFGASERLVVSPGRENAGLFHMPGGQSGNPLSKNFRDGFDDWMRGAASSLLPGNTKNSLLLVP